MDFKASTVDPVLPRAASSGARQQPPLDSLTQKTGIKRVKGRSNLANNTTAAGQTTETTLQGNFVRLSFGGYRGQRHRVGGLRWIPVLFAGVPLVYKEMEYPDGYGILTH